MKDVFRKTFVLGGLIGCSCIGMRASPIIGGRCDEGTLAEFIALGSNSCYITTGIHAEQISNISASLPGAVSAADFFLVTNQQYGTPEGPGVGPLHSAVGAGAYRTDNTLNGFPIGSVLTVHFQSRASGVIGGWYEFADAPMYFATGDPTFSWHPFSFTGDTNTITTGTIVMTATVQNSHLGFDMFQVIVPEPSELTPVCILIAGFLLMSRKGSKK